MPVRQDTGEADRLIAAHAISVAKKHAEELGKLIRMGMPDAQAIERAKQAVTYDLKDPDSAQFRDLQLMDYYGGKLLCGEINAKNSYGGYIGYVPFYAGANGGFIKDRDSQPPELAGLIQACTNLFPIGPTTKSCDEATIGRLIASGLSTAQIDVTCGRKR